MWKLWLGLCSGHQAAALRGVAAPQAMSSQCFCELAPTLGGSSQNKADTLGSITQEVWMEFVSPAWSLSAWPLPIPASPRLTPLASPSSSSS